MLRAVPASTSLAETLPALADVDRSLERVLATTFSDEAFPLPGIAALVSHAQRVLKALAGACHQPIGMRQVDPIEVQRMLCEFVDCMPAAQATRLDLFVHYPSIVHQLGSIQHMASQFLPTDIVDFDASNWVADMPLLQEYVESEALFQDAADWMDAKTRAMLEAAANLTDRMPRSLFNDTANQQLQWTAKNYWDLALKRIDGEAKSIKSVSVESVDVNNVAPNDSAPWRITLDDVVIDSAPFVSTPTLAFYRGTYCGQRVVFEQHASPNAVTKDITTRLSLAHPNLLRALHASDRGPRLGVLSEQPEYGTLSVFLRLVPVSLPLRLELLLGAAQGLAYLHAHGVVHGAVSTDTIGVCDAVGGTYAAKWSFHGIKATPAPEGDATTTASDVYGFGLCLLRTHGGASFALDGSAEDTVAKVARGERPENMSRELWSLCQRMCQRSPQDRPPMASVVATLEAAVHLHSPPVGTCPPPDLHFEKRTPVVDPAARQRQRSRRRAKVCAVLLLLLLGGAVAAGIEIAASIDGSNAAGNSTNNSTPNATSNGTLPVIVVPLLDRVYEVSTLAGTGNPGMAGGPALNSSFMLLQGIAVDDTATYVYFGDQYGLRRLDLVAGLVYAFAGIVTTPGSYDSIGSGSSFASLTSLAWADSTTLLIADQMNNKIRQVNTTTSAVSTVAGSYYGNTDGPALSAAFAMPSGVAYGSNKIYVADTSNVLIKTIDAGYVSTLSGTYNNVGAMAGTAPTYQHPVGLAVAPSGIVYIADSGNNMIRKLYTNGTVVNIGSGTSGFANGSSSIAEFNNPQAVTVDTNGNVFVADTGNSCIRAIDLDDNVLTIAGTCGSSGHQDGAAASALFSQPASICIGSNDVLYVSDTSNYRIRAVAYL
ncbi:hypothetical protein ACHHYP_15863 [Achlya hypogyna]|uniref:Protein kinase domain-containing protein n=1 Tax=Achlya hypogyna TaxID=1202772 RepID=A0A1V9Y9Z5_ACHHY|nr:hypothetical protein ACHHYP_15863 [Achlya hypogyna]